MRPIEVLLIQHSANSDNLGVGALTAAQIAILEDAAKTAGRTLNILIAGWRDPRAPYISASNIRHCEIDRKEILSRSGMWQRFKAADIVLDIGAGDSFADIYGGKRLVLNLLLKEMAYRNRVPLVLSPQTIGPFSRGWARRGALRAVRRASLVCTRDAKSTAYLREAGFTGEVLEATDVAMRLPYTAAPRRDADGPVRVGLNVSGLLMNGGYTGGNMFELESDYPTLVRRILDDLTAREDVDVELVGHVISDNQPIEDDYRAAEALAQEYSGVGVAPRFASPSDAKSHISGYDFFAGARMHACIAAFSSGVAVVPMAYSRKFSGLFGTLGYDHTADCKTMSTDEVVRRVIAGFETRDQLQSDAKAAFAKAHDRLQRYEDALAALMADL